MEEPIRLTIFHTNDMHGRQEPLSRLSNFARRLRTQAAAEGRQVFFWDAGDAADRRFRITSATKGAASVDLLNAMGIELQTMGNAISLPYGPGAFKAVAERANFPILAANMRDGDGPLVEGLQESVLIRLGPNAALGVFGLTAPWQAPPWNGLYETFGLHLPEFRDVARQVIAKLRAEGATAIAVLSHLGLEDDIRLAESVEGIDLIIGGHSHHRLPAGEEHHGVLIAQAGDFAQALGRVDLEIDPSSGRVISRRAALQDVPAEEPLDPQVEAAIRRAEAEVEAIFARVVGRLDRALDLDHFAECGIGNLAADALRERMQAEAALVASGMFHAGLPAGDVTVGALNQACFSSANPAVSLVKGSDIAAALEHGLDPQINRAEPGGLRGAPLGIPQISGLRVEYQPQAPLGRKIRRILVNGQPLDPERRYRLAHTDTEIRPSIGYTPSLEDVDTQFEVPTILGEVIADYLAAHSPLPEPEVGRWLVVDETP